MNERFNNNAGRYDAGFDNTGGLGYLDINYYEMTPEERKELAHQRVQERFSRHRRELHERRVANAKKITAGILAAALVVGVIGSFATESAKAEQRAMTKIEQKIADEEYEIIENATIVVGPDGTNVRYSPKVINPDDGEVGNIIGTLEPGQNIHADIVVSNDDKNNGPFYGVPITAVNEASGGKLSHVPENCEYAWVSSNTTKIANDKINL